MIQDDIQLPSDDGKAVRTRRVRSLALVLVLLAFAALLYALTIARLLG